MNGTAYRTPRRASLLVAVLCMLAVCYSEALSRRAQAADMMTRTFDYGVIVRHQRIQVANTPIAVSKGERVRIQGWVLDSHTMKPGAKLMYSMDGGVPKVVADYPRNRPDVAAATHDPDAAKSGFELQFEADQLPLGTHRVHFILIDPNGAVTSLPTDVQLAVGK